MGRSIWRLLSLPIKASKGKEKEPRERKGEPERGRTIREAWSPILHKYGFSILWVCENSSHGEINLWGRVYKMLMLKSLYGPE